MRVIELAHTAAHHTGDAPRSRGSLHAPSGAGTAFAGDTPGRRTRGGAILGGLHAGRVMRLVAGIRHGFLPSMPWALVIAFVDVDKVLLKKRIYM